MVKKRKAVVPRMILWDRRDQLRFIEAVEKVCGLVGELVTAAKCIGEDSVLLTQQLNAARRSDAARRANATRRRRPSDPNGETGDSPIIVRQEGETDARE